MNTPLQSPPISIVHKKRGETLAVLLERFCSEYMIAPTVPLTYAGRLDPMASGVMIILTGDACKEKEQYLGLDKTYRFSVLLGVSTDTYDVLGKIDKVSFLGEVMHDNIERALDDIQATPSFPYPPYSSRPVDGIPLFAHARQGTLPSAMPLQSGSIEKLTLIDIQTLPFSRLVHTIVSDIENVQGDFRQEAIIEGWRELQAQQSDRRVSIVECEATVSSGMYIRSIAHTLGLMLGVPTLAYTIARIRVGPYT